jgi:hypothetical protein
MPADYIPRHPTPEDARRVIEDKLLEGLASESRVLDEAEWDSIRREARARVLDQKNESGRTSQ